MKVSVSVTTLICLISLILVGFHLYFRNEGHLYADNTLWVAFVLGAVALLSFMVRGVLWMVQNRNSPQDEEVDEGPLQDQ